MNLREHIIRYSMLTLGLFIMALGVSLSIKANLGTTPISCIPYVLSLGLHLTVGEFTIIFNILLILLQILLLRKDFEKWQLLQIIVVIMFGYFTDLTLWLLTNINVNGYILEWIITLISCFTLAFGILIEVKAEVIYMAGEGIVLAISKVIGIEFGKVKPFFDVSMVIIGVISSFLLVGKLSGIREGTIIAAIIIGLIVKFYKDLFGDKIDKLRDNLIKND